MARNLILNNPKHIRIPTPLNDDVAFSFFDFYLAQETIFPSPLPSRPIGSRRTFLLTVMWYITTHVSLVCSLFFFAAAAGACHSSLSLSAQRNISFTLKCRSVGNGKEISRKTKIEKNEPSIASFVVCRVLRLPFLAKCFLFRLAKKVEALPAQSQLIEKNRDAHCRSRSKGRPSKHH